MEKPFVSYAQNSEDVVLWRALQHISRGRYVDVGANDPHVFSVTKVFADAGWEGVCVEPLPELAQRIREARPDAHVFEGVVSDVDGELVLHAIADTGLSTLVDDIGTEHAGAGYDVEELTVRSRRLDDVLSDFGWDGQDIHLVTVDTEGSEPQVLAGFDLARWRPWVVVVESTAPLRTEQTHDQWEQGVLDAGYTFCLFDGLSRFYVANERLDALQQSLDHGACIFDDYVPERYLEHLTERERLGHLSQELTTQVLHWRNTAFEHWAELVAERLSHARKVQRLDRARKRVEVLDKRVRELEASRSFRVAQALGGRARRIAGR